MEMILNSHGKKGCYAYLAPVIYSEGELKIRDPLYGDPVPPATKHDLAQGRLCKVKFDLSRLKDGIYKWQERDLGTWRKSQGFIKIKAGEIEEDLSEEEALNLFFPLLNLPPLRGTPRQVIWAEKIRARAIRSGLVKKSEGQETSAKFWIENRSRFGF